MKNRIHAIQLYVQHLKGKYPTAGWVEGPIAEYCDIRDINKAIMDLADDQPFLEEILDKITQQALYYSEAQIDAV